jgi:stage II sporulation protein M
MPEMSYKKWVIIATVLFGTGIALGLFIPAVEGLAVSEISGLEELFKILAPFQIFTCVFILLNNTLTFLISFFLSPILCLVPILALVLNGCLLAFVSMPMIEGGNLSMVLLGILPHGVFELPAFIMAEAAALSFGTEVMRALLQTKRRATLRPTFRRGMRYLLIAILLLIPAAIIETYVTPLVIGYPGNP